MRSLARFLFAIGLLTVAANSRANAQQFDPALYKGQVVYLDFWASWCVPCRLSFPWMNELQAQYGDRGFTVIAVNVDHDGAAAQQFLSQVPASFKIVYDPAGKIASKYPIKGMPTSFLIGRDGSIRFEHDGFSDARRNEYLAHILALIGEKK
ncbi:MAG TPA: TlpA disulfide reductase family protein [Rhizomicrobium sp.]|nr:TlpA disulfide reductase family protein [Rhizomicrobium sp.]